MRLGIVLMREVGRTIKVFQKIDNLFHINFKVLFTDSKMSPFKYKV